MHPIAIYTYDAAGQRAIRYNYDHIDVYSNGEEMAQSREESIMLYPNGLIMGKAIHGKDYLNDPVNSVEYTKHYYVGSERVGSKTGTIDWRNTKYIFGNFPHRHVSEKMGNLSIQETMQKGVDRLTAAQTLMGIIFTALGQQVPTFNNIPVPEQGLSEDIPHEASKLNMYYFHPDHLGSSSYITNKEGKVSQHMEYLPFGETLVDEHVNSNNSPFKFNGKEYDEETGNYYYSARYYDPKLSIFISVDPMVEKTMDAYGYCYQNPVKLVDPTGMQAEQIEGVNDASAQKVHEDMNKVFASTKFDSFRSLLTRGKNNTNKKFDKIDKDAFQKATKDLKGDDLDLATSVYNSINSKDKLVFEYITSKSASVSSSGGEAFAGMIKSMLGSGPDPSDVKGSAISQMGSEGLTVPTSLVPIYLLWIQVLLRI